MGWKRLNQGLYQTGEGEGQLITRATFELVGQGAVIITPNVNKSLQIFAISFTLGADIEDIVFYFEGEGVLLDRYLSPKAGGLYGKNTHPDWCAGKPGKGLICAFDAPGVKVQVNVSYNEVS